MREPIPSRDALKGWKSIADYFGRDASTVMRWEAQRGLPVRRVPGALRSSVYALPGELASWLEATSTEDAVAIDVSLVTKSLAVTSPSASSVPAGSADSNLARRTRAPMIISAFAVAGIAITGVLASRLPDGPVVQAVVRDPTVEREVLAATYDLNLRTPASLERARASFGAIIARDPTAAPAYAGLSEVFLLLREYTPFPSIEAYRAAEAAAKAAITLDPNLLAAHRALAFAAFWGEHDVPTARAEFARARALAPQNAQTWHWYATALSANGEAVAALDAIETARRLEPQSTPIASDYGLLAYLAGRKAEGIQTLDAVAAGSPTDMSAHRYLADLALERGDGATYLAESAVACRLRNDGAECAALTAERVAFAQGGRVALLAAIAERRRQQATANDGHVALAKVLALQGNRAGADDQLRLAAAVREPSLAELPGEIMLRGLAGKPNYDALRVRGTLTATVLPANL